MSDFVLTATLRPTGKQAAKQVRRRGLVPGIFYTPGAEPIPIAVKPLALRPLVYTRETHLVQLRINALTGSRVIFTGIPPAVRDGVIVYQCPYGL